jgi:hypothetical protein
MAMDAMPLRGARDQGEGMEPRGSTSSGGPLNGKADQAAILDWLNANLHPDKVREFLGMLGLDPDELEMNTHRREEQDLEDQKVAQDQRADFLRRYPGAGKLKWAI